jgi:hypothetical protein
MTVDDWLREALADADRRGLPDLKPLLETLGEATRALRSADFNESATGCRQPSTEDPLPPAPEPSTAQAREKRPPE